MRIYMQNKNDKNYENMLNDLIQEVFGFSFEPWHRMNLWNERYESYSIIENEKMLSNVCIFKTDFILQGKSVQAHQLGAVATRKDCRNKGYSRKLMQFIEEKYPQMPAFLFANASVRDFYPQFGFKRVFGGVQKLEIEINNQLEAVKLSIDDKRVADFIENRKCFSNVTDCTNTQSVQMFHMLIDYPENIYYIPNVDVIVVAEQDGDRLFIADIIAKKPINFEDIKPFLPFSGIKQVEFGFSADWLGILEGWQKDGEESGLLFVRGNFNLPDLFKFPVMSET
jgi:Predicted acyltransferase